VVDTKRRMPSVQEAQYEDAGVSGKHIRRLYVLVCAALVLVLVGIIVAVSLSLTIGKQPVPATVDNSNNTAPTPASTESPRPTTPEPVSMPSTTPADATTTSAPEAPSTVPASTTSPGTTEMPVSTVTRPPGRKRRVEHRREGKVHPHLRSRGQSNQ
jgi:cytoskeletal protein RodZ